MQWISSLFSTAGVPARWNCGSMWNAEPWWGWLHIISDVAIYAAYTAIPAILIYVVRKKSDLPFSKLFWLFAAFISACGTTHLIDAVIFYWPIYKIGAILKLVTAVVSTLTVIAVVRVLPSAMSLRSHSFLEHLLLQKEQDIEKANQQTAEMHASYALQAERLRIANEAAGLMPWTWNLMTDEVELSPLLEEMFQLGPNSTAADFLGYVEEPDRSRLISTLRKVIEENADYNEEFRMRDAAGNLRWIAGRGRIVERVHGRPTIMAGVNYDVTPHRRIQERMATAERALASTTNGVAILDITGEKERIIWTNASFTELTRRTHHDLNSRSLDTLFGPKTDPLIVAGLRNSIRLQKEGSFTLLIYSRDDREIWVEMTLSSVQADRGNVTQMVAVFNDISERIKHEGELQKAKRVAEQANEAKSLFLANMSHEIRTPLTAILGCADSLFPVLTTDEQREVLQVIRGQGRLLLGALNDVLDLSKIEAGKLDITHQPCSVAEIAAEVTNLMQPSAIEKKLNLKFECDGMIPETVVSDPVRVRQIVLNLVSNAIKFTPHGNVTVRCSCTTEKAHAILSVSVEDTGVGISSEDLKEIFVAFSQASSNRSLQARGTGLGLTIAQRLAHLLGGRIKVESVENRGSKFTFEMDVGPESSVRMVDSSRIMDTIFRMPTLASTPLRLNKVLVAEDTRSIQFMLQKMLQPISEQVVVVGNGSEAVEMVKDSTTFDVILMDMQMPIMSGFEAARELRKRGICTPIVALTAGALAGDREKCIAAGCNDYVSKPVEYEKLFSIIRNCTSMKNADKLTLL